ncbi:CGNR zinc finger domain-containing protein [Nonomuraea sp. NPDC049421]|uniref:CGNR zinc finger domain-containing protein n=1 Tax=Nonomuraea sp. NPDC049421 TaxID=3155275 RepID=UPI00341B2450
MPAVPVLDVRHVVAFVNEYADPPREAAGEQETPYPDAHDLLAWPPGLALPATGGLVAAANAVFPVFAAARDGRALEELNALLRAVRPLPVAAPDGLRWTAGDAADLLPAALATCLLSWLMTHEQARLGTCHASRCVDVYTDASPAGQRRFCSATCLNRHKVAAYRKRASARKVT